MGSIPIKKNKCGQLDAVVSSSVWIKKTKLEVQNELCGLVDGYKKTPKTIKKNMTNQKKTRIKDFRFIIHFNGTFFWLGG